MTFQALKKYSWLSFLKKDDDILWRITLRALIFQTNLSKNWHIVNNIASNSAKIKSNYLTFTLEYLQNYLELSEKIIFQVSKFTMQNYIILSLLLKLLFSHSITIKLMNFLWIHKCQKVHFLEKLKIISCRLRATPSKDTKSKDMYGTITVF